jgi:hypothetical protein
MPSRPSGGTASIRTRRLASPTCRASSGPMADRSSPRRTGRRPCPTWSAAGCPPRTSRSARTASAGATPARRCARTSRSIHPRSRRRRSPPRPLRGDQAIAGRRGDPRPRPRPGAGRAPHRLRRPRVGGALRARGPCVQWARPVSAEPVH